MRLSSSYFVPLFISLQLSRFLLLLYLLRPFHVFLFFTSSSTCHSFNSPFLRGLSPPPPFFFLAPLPLVSFEYLSLCVFPAQSLVLPRLPFPFPLRVQIRRNVPNCSWLRNSVLPCLEEKDTETRLNLPLECTDKQTNKI